MNKTNQAHVMPKDIACAMIPIISLVAIIATFIIARGATSVADIGWVGLLLSAFIAVVVSALRRQLSWSRLWRGILKSASQLGSAVPILLCIGLISTTWMLGGIVPTMIDLGIKVLSVDWFLPVTCLISAAVSVLLGSSWTTIATVGLAFMGIGNVFGYSEGWTAGAIIAGAYFGDKVSPLSDTTVIASSSCGVPLFVHIRNLMGTSLPAMAIGLVVYAVAGLCFDTHQVNPSSEIINGLERVFVITPWLMLAPLATIVLCLLRLKSLVVLILCAAMGLIAMFATQPQMVAYVTEDSLFGVVRMLLASTEPETGSEMLNSLVATGGMAGMLPTVLLVLSAMTFGGTLIGTGMLSTITHALTSKLSSRQSLVSATAGTGLVLNSCTGDQYLSIIIGANIYRNAYERGGHEAKLLSRTLEDSVSVTSVLIPWNSCGVTQSTVLGVATLTYLPYCFFNYLSPILTVAFAHFKPIEVLKRRLAPAA